MKTSDFSPRVVVVALATSLLSTACIITGSADDDDDGSSPTSATSGQDSAMGVDPGTSGGGGGGVDPGPLACELSDNVVLDPGFEEGTPSSSWAESSVLFETPICDGGCTDEPGAEPFAGDWWVWLGGDPERADTASVEQDITVPPGMAAALSFQFQIRSGAGTGDDIFFVELVDGDITDTIFLATDAEMPDFDLGYHRVDLDISDWADGGTYTLRFGAETMGSGELTSFFVDDVRVASCGDNNSGVDSGSSTGGADDTSGSSGSGGVADSTGTTSGSDSSDSSGGDSGSSSSSSGA